MFLLLVRSNHIPTPSNSVLSVVHGDLVVALHMYCSNCCIGQVHCVNILYYYYTGEAFNCECESCKCSTTPLIIGVVVGIIGVLVGTSGLIIACVIVKQR